MSPDALTPLLEEEDGTAAGAHANGGSLEAGGLAKVTPSSASCESCQAAASCHMLRCWHLLPVVWR